MPFPLVVVPPVGLHTGSNSPRDSPGGIPSGSFANQLTCRVNFLAWALPPTCPELCRSLHTFPSSASLSERLAQSFVTERINIGSREARKGESESILLTFYKLRRRINETSEKERVPLPLCLSLCLSPCRFLLVSLFPRLYRFVAFSTEKRDEERRSFVGRFAPFSRAKKQERVSSLDLSISLSFSSLDCVALSAAASKRGRETLLAARRTRKRERDTNQPLL
jgi:hypothetical protein